MSGVSPEDVLAYAERARLDQSEIDPDSQVAAIEAQDDLISKLDELDSPSAPDREYWDPDETEDPYAAFLTKCDLHWGDEGVLAGRTVAVKDNIAVAGVPMTCGSPLLTDHVPTQDAAVVERMLHAGGRIVGKANMDEFALGGDAEAMRFRLAQNPNDPEHQPGGSSAGSGVAVANDQVDVALGTDTGGSVRFPASFCGVVGFKPSRGLVPLTGFVQFSKINDEIGMLSNTVENAARALTAMAGPDPRDDATRGATAGAYIDAVRGVDSSDAGDITVGVPDELFGGEPAVDETVRDAIDELAVAGATVREVSIPGIEYAIPAWWTIAMTEVAAYVAANGVNYWQRSESSAELAVALAEAFEERPAELGEYTANVLIYGHHLMEQYGNEYYARAQRARGLVTEGVDTALDGVDVLATPTTPIVAPAWDGENYLEDDTLEEAVRTTGPFNLTGHPAVSVPCGDVDGLPVGLQFVGGRDSDASVLRTAAIWEAIRE